MKKYIRDMIDDLRRKTVKLDKPPEPALPGDLNNQILSDDPLERVRQLDFQAQKDEERESS
jgi:hypothetical protein